MTTPASWRRIGAGVPRFGGVGGFLAWWGRSLLAWLPRRWREVLGFDRGRLLLQAEGSGILVRHEGQDGLRDLAHLPEPPESSSADAQLLSMLAPAARDLPRWLLVPAGASLRRRLVLPSAALERLRDVVGFEIDRQTPYEAADVAYDTRLLGRRESDGQLDVELVAVPRNALAASEAAIGDLRDTLAGVDVLGSDGVPLGVNLLAPDARRKQVDPMRAWNMALAAIAVVALVALLWQWLQNRRAVADAFEGVVAERVEAARRVTTQRQVLVDTVEGQAFLDRLRASRPTAIEILDELTRRTPEGTFVEKLAIESDRITVIGRSSEASALVGRLDGAEVWREPALTGALQPDPRSGKDIFTLVADVAVAGNGGEAGRDAGR